MERYYSRYRRVKKERKLGGGVVAYEAASCRQRHRPLRLDMNHPLESIVTAGTAELQNNIRLRSEMERKGNSWRVCSGNTENVRQSIAELNVMRQQQISTHL